MSSIAANENLFDFVVAGQKGSDALRVMKVDGLELLSGIYKFEIELAVESDTLLPSDFLQKTATLTLKDPSYPRLVNGVIISFEQKDTGRRFTRYGITLAPKAWTLTKRTNTKIFQHQTVPDIIKSVLLAANLSTDDFTFQLMRNYQPRTYLVQYDENDLHFISRLMEEEGIHFHFQHTSDRHRMVMADSQSALTTIPGGDLLYQDISGMVNDADSVHKLRKQAQTQFGKVSMRDYNFKKPSLNLEVSQNVDGDDYFEQYQYPGNYQLPEEGDEYAKLRMEAKQTNKVMLKGASNSRRLLPGHRVNITEHAHFEGEYLITQVKHEGTNPQALDEGAPSQGGHYINYFDCIPADKNYRPAQKHKKVLIESTQSAVVTGPAGEEIYTDKHGRIKVQFHWDRDGQKNEKTTRWLRVNTGIAGGQWGQVAIPRIGQEVVIEYLDGNPDNPMVTGCVYHANNKVPYELPAHKSRSTFKTESSPGGGGFNELRFEDKKGQEQIYIHAQKDMDIKVKNDHREHINGHRHLVVGKDSLIVIEGDAHWQKDKNERIEIGQNRHIESQSSTYTKFGQAYLEKCRSEHHAKASRKIVMDARVELTAKVGGNFIKLDPSGVTIVGSTISFGSGSASRAKNVAALPLNVIQGQEEVIAKAAKTGTPLVSDCASNGECVDCTV
ncbi:type VI secretion system tip protein VgrG [Zooshikella marina]|uniref:type VI secretion system Vgr family protein n=1 Tax=Zooshikella ganghwensis TaxID=202772 RepID=UPI001BAE5A93|nr:type VI secretion system tip protein TssI/VgrG [Zooshikella ganghwensis]MBU2706467.1 type VI secretion system tip protein VgrG [Zooshikella ganghwensis]